MARSLSPDSLATHLAEHGADRVLVRYVMRFAEDALSFGDLWRNTHDGPMLLGLAGWSTIDRDEARSALAEVVRVVLDPNAGPISYSTAGRGLDT